MLHRLVALAALLTALPGSGVVPTGTSSPFAAAVPPGPHVAACAEQDGWQVRRGQDALASLRTQDASGYQLVFRAERDGYYGITRPRSRSIEVYIRSCTAQSSALLRHVVAHELGHAYDAVRLTEADRRAWRRARGIAADTPWYGCNRCTDFATPAGDFAEVYAQWARGATSNRSTLASAAPDAAQLSRLADRFFSR